jgi:hypothetical protein
MASWSAEVNKIYKKIDSITKLGKDGYFDYSTYEDSLVSDSKYGFFEMALMKRYFIDITTFLSVNDMKKKTYPKLLFYQYNNDAVNIKAMYDKYRVYQVGFNIYSTDSNVLLGQIKEVSRFDTSNTVLITDAGMPIVDIEVIIGPVVVPSVYVTNGTYLVNKYETAVQMLLANDWVLLSGSWDDYGHWIDTAVWIDSL